MISCATLFPASAQAHDAFGDLGPFYQNFLHPLADPALGLVLAAAAVLLARQPRDSVRVAYAAAVAAGCLAALLHLALPGMAVSIRVVGLIAVCLAVLALPGFALPKSAAAILVGATSLFAGLSTDLQQGARAAALASAGTAAGIALFILLFWGMVDLAQERLGRVAGAVASSWIAAIGLMVVALPR